MKNIIFGEFLRVSILFLNINSEKLVPIVAKPFCVNISLREKELIKQNKFERKEVCSLAVH